MPPCSSDRPEAELYQGLDGDRGDSRGVADSPLLLSTLAAILIGEQPDSKCAADVALEFCADGRDDEVIGILGCQFNGIKNYSGVNKGLYVLLSRTHAGPGRTVKQEQERNFSQPRTKTFTQLRNVTHTKEQ